MILNRVHIDVTGHEMKLASAFIAVAPRTMPMSAMQLEQEPGVDFFRTEIVLGAEILRNHGGTLIKQGVSR